MDGTMREVWGRLPLAEGVLWLWGWVTDDAFLDDLYQHWRGRSYEKVLTFPTSAHLIVDALLKREGSTRQSFERADEVDALPTSIQAAYGQLRWARVGRERRRGSYKERNREEASPRFRMMARS